MTDHADLIERLDDLYLQATQERSHYYTGRVVSDAAAALRDLVRERDELKERLAKWYGLFFEKQDTAQRIAKERDALKAALQRLYDADIATRDGDHGGRWQAALRSAEAALAAAKEVGK